MARAEDDAVVALEEPCSVVNHARSECGTIHLQIAREVVLQVKVEPRWPTGSDNLVEVALAAAAREHPAPRARDSGSGKAPPASGAVLERPDSAVRALIGTRD